MDYRAAIQESLDYMEANLRAELTAAELAQRAGFSLYHFYRLFHSAVGMPVMQYLTRRRLLHGAWAMARGQTGIQAALDYGFDTYPGFYRAFRREFGCTIAEFLEAGRGKAPRRVNILQEEHMMITKKKAAGILGHWGLEWLEITDIYYENGQRNENAYYVGDSLVLKFTSNLGKVKTHCALARAIGEVGLLSAQPVPTEAGEDWVCDGEVYFYLTRRLPGKQLAAERIFDAGNARLLGELIGQLHLALQKVDALVNDADLLETVRSWALPEAKKVLNLPESFWEKFLDEFHALYSELPRQIIHRDPHPGNLIGGDGQWGFIDFELSERNARIYDPCYAATAILSELPKDAWAGWTAICREILAGYDEVVQLTDAERAAVPHIILANQLVCTAWFAGQDKYTELLKTNIAMTRFIAEKLDEIGMER